MVGRVRRWSRIQEPGETWHCSGCAREWAAKARPSAAEQDSSAASEPGVQGRSQAGHPRRFPHDADVSGSAAVPRLDQRESGASRRKTRLIGHPTPAPGLFLELLSSRRRARRRPGSSSRTCSAAALGYGSLKVWATVQTSQFGSLMGHCMVQAQKKGEF